MKFEASALKVVPGSSAELVCRVRNDGDTVEAYRVRVVGEPAAWSTAEPMEFSLYPDGEQDVVVTVRPPTQPRLEPQLMALALHVVPESRPGAAVTAEPWLEICEFAALDVLVEPLESRGRRSGYHRVRLRNQGNTAVCVTFAGADQQRKLAYRPPRHEVRVEPANDKYAWFRVRARRLAFTGPPERTACTLTVSPDLGDPQLFELGFTRKPFISAGQLKLLVAAGVLTLAAATLWLFGPMPRMNSTARNASGVLNPQGGPANPPSAPPPTPVPFTKRLDVHAAPGETVTAPGYKVPEGQSVGIAGLIAQNPQADTGSMRILVNGSPLLDIALDTLKTQPLAFNNPLRLAAGQVVTVSVTCKTPAGATPATSPPPSGAPKTSPPPSGTPSASPSPSPAPSPTATACAESVLLNGTITPGPPPPLTDPTPSAAPSPPPGGAKP